MSDQAAMVESVLAGAVAVGACDVPDGVAEAFSEMAAASAERRAAQRAEAAERKLVVEPIPGALIRPGDVLVLAVPGSLTMAQAEALKRAAMERMPKLADVVVLGGGTVAGVYREEAPQP